MSLSEAIPTLKAVKQVMEECHDKITLYRKPEDPELKELLPKLSYDGELKALASEVSNQIRTANRPYTVAVVGEFKVGKSTLLNGILGLHGDEALSTEATPDTACSIILRHRSPGDPESRIHFADRPEPEDTSWEKAKRLTSQTWLDNHPSDQKRARQLIEVEYFLDKPLLVSINLNDLPGTGSRYWREHTKRTHETMKQADAVVWVVGDDEPSADAKLDLEILKECTQSVIPVLNVREDPSVSPPIPRRRNEEDAIAVAVTREFKQYFSSQFNEPVRVSARVVELEMSKTSPDPIALKEAGFEELITIFDEMIISPAHGQAGGRLQRICGATVKLASDAESVLRELCTSLELASNKIRATVEDRDEDLAKLEDLSIELKTRIKTLARERASDITTKVGNLAKVFIGDTLQMSNWDDFRTALKKNGEERLSDELRMRFIKHYLKTDQPKNWLTELSQSFAMDVRDVSMPLFRQLVRRQLQELSLRSDLKIEPPDLDRLSDELLHAVNEVVNRIVYIGAIAGLLAVIPGGQIIDALAIVGLIILSAIHDPLEGARRRAENRVVWQMDAQKYAIAGALIQAADEGTSSLKTELRSWFVSKKTQASMASNSVSDTMNSVQSGMERLSILIEGLQQLKN